MKTFLATVSVLGLTTSMAMADCAGHAKVNAAVDVDRSTTTAGVSDTDDTVVAAKKKPVEKEATTTQ